jgi:hypothetical protein
MRLLIGDFAASYDSNLANAGISNCQSDIVCATQIRKAGYRR